MEKHSGQIVLASCVLVVVLLIGAAGVGGFIAYRLALTATAAASTAVVALASSMSGVVQMENVLREGNSEQRIEVLEDLREFLQESSTELPPKEFLDILLPALEEAETDEDPRVTELCNEVRKLLQKLEPVAGEPVANENLSTETVSGQESKVPETQASQEAASDDE